MQDLGWRPRVLTFGAAQPDEYPYPVTRIARAPYPIRQARYAAVASGHLAWADLVFSQTIDLPLLGWRERPRVIKIVGDQAWERCIRRGWIPSELGIEEFQTFDGDWRVRWQRRSRSRQVAAMNAVIVPSQYLKRMVSAWGVDPDKIHVIYNALPAAPAARQTRDEIRSQLAWDDRPTLITVARLQPWKGVDHLLAALRGLSEIRLVVVGDGPDRARLQSLAEALGDRVIFTGALKGEAVQRLLRAADGFALYSAYEGLSHSLLESLRLGAPVLASAVGGNPEIVRHGVNGLLVPHVDVAALGRSIVELLDRRREFAANCHVDMERFALTTVARQTDRLLRSLLP